MTVVLVVVMTGALLACAYQRGSVATDGPGFLIEPPGFLMGLVHGAIAPPALIGGLFSDIRIYAFPNSGLGYDFGFLIGLSLWGGGGAYAGHRRIAG
jgi:hypothetical protein